MKKEFKPRTKKVTTIGEELRFQREYYCYKNNVSLPLRINSTVKENDERDSLQDILYKYILKEYGNNSELATSYDVLYAIENGKCKKKNEIYNANAYFLRMFCLLKMYNFLDGYSIMELLQNKYNLKPSFETSKIITKKLEDNYSIQNALLDGKKEKIIKANIKLGIIFCAKDTFLKFTTKEERIQMGIEQINHCKKIFKGFFNAEEAMKNPEEWTSEKYNFRKEKQTLIEKMKRLNQIEQYCTSLELGRETTYIQDFINDNLRNISIETFLKTLEYFNMQEEKLYYVLKLIKDDFSAYSIILSNILK